MIPNLFGPKDQFYERQFFYQPGWGDVFRMIQVHYIYCALYFYYYYISSTSDDQALDPRGWGPLFPFFVLLLIYGSCLLTNFIALWILLKVLLFCVLLFLICLFFSLNSLTERIWAHLSASTTQSDLTSIYHRLYLPLMGMSLGSASWLYWLTGHIFFFFLSFFFLKFILIGG